MLVDVSFDGVSLARGANARPDGNGWFVELEQPMPVGTLLDLSGETQAAVRVARVTEGVGAGMLLVPAAADAKPANAKPTEAKVAEAKVADGKPTDAKVAEAKAADGKPTEAKVAEAKAADGDGEDEPESSGAPKSTNGAGKDRRRRQRKPTGA